MKKIVICLLVIAMLALCLAGCRDDKDKTETQSSTEAVSESDTDKTEQTEQPDLTEENPQVGAEEETNQEEENTESQATHIEEDDGADVIEIVIPGEDSAVGGEDLD